ncbi:GNAT family N-acetyltransferase [Methylomonas sp. LL1]|uniref:GNAT family N-acetyltransferase n=1 Tax=Methylomonas sp. LL1 TaxID=2785785 RepID=UPI0018C35F64|nr:GNAT family N-acetyltransferase [Methylomonas sp. LL1]QPK65168.1 GNAT family N-acetyltransferase [Methylomonas sp. LL1]
MDGLEFVRLGIDDERDPSFDCGDPDLNEFFLEDSKANCRELLAVTYAWRLQDKTIAYFSVSNDAITSQDVDNFNRFRRMLPNRKRYKTMPAVKIGRFAVHKDYKKQKYGSKIMDFIKIWFVTGNKTGCRFVIVDALNKDDVLPFYENNGFSYLTQKDKSDHTRLMYFDLMQIAHAV